MGFSYRWAEANVPVYYKSAVEHSKPYLQTCLDMGLGTLNHLSIWYENIRIYIEDSVPVIIAWVSLLCISYSFTLFVNVNYDFSSVC